MAMGAHRNYSREGFVSDIAIFVLKRDVKLQLTNSREGHGLGEMARAECEAIMGIWGQSPSGAQGQSPSSGGQAPLKLRALKHLHT